MLGAGGQVDNQLNVVLLCTCIDEFKFIHSSHSTANKSKLNNGGLVGNKLTAQLNRVVVEHRQSHELELETSDKGEEITLRNRSRNVH